MSSSLSNWKYDLKKKKKGRPFSPKPFIFPEKINIIKGRQTSDASLHFWTVIVPRSFSWPLRFVGLGFHCFYFFSVIVSPWTLAGLIYFNLLLLRSILMLPLFLLWPSAASSSWVVSLWLDPIGLESLLAPGITRCPRITGCSSCPGPGVSHFSKEFSVL